MSGPRELTIESFGLKLQAKAWNPGGMPVLAVAGWLDNANSFDRLAPLLPQFNIVALDMPGHGRSQHRHADASYHFVDWVDVGFDVAESLGWERFTFMGHSMGAGVGVLMAGTFPERLQRLILLDGFGPLTGEPPQTPEQLATHVREQSRLRVKQLPVYASPADMAKLLVRIVPGLTPVGAGVLVERGSRAVEGGYTWSSDPRLRGTSSMRLTEAQVLAFLARITCPSLLVRADRGYPFDAEPMQRRLSTLAALQHVTVPGGHHVHLEDPEPVAAAISSFLAAGDRAMAGRQSQPHQ